MKPTARTKPLPPEEGSAKRRLRPRGGATFAKPSWPVSRIREVGGQSTRLRLRVIPGSGKAGVVGRYGDAWKLRVAARAERGKANDATVELLSQTLGVAATDVSLIAGHATRDKTVEITGLTAAEAERRLAR